MPVDDEANETMLLILLNRLIVTLENNVITLK